MFASCMRVTHKTKLKRKGKKERIKMIHLLSAISWRSQSDVGSHQDWDLIKAPGNEAHDASVHSKR